MSNKLKAESSHASDEYRYNVEGPFKHRLPHHHLNKDSSQSNIAGKSEDKKEASERPKRRTSQLDEDEILTPKHLRDSDGLSIKVATHYNNIQDRGINYRNSSNIIGMRNFNNWIKTILIQKSMKKVRLTKPDDANITILDLGCGKGGDLVKWQRVGIEHYIGADIANTSIIQCEQRYKSMNNTRDKLFSAEFMVADCTKVKLRPHFRDPSIKVDVVSCQFAFHYCFESLSQAEMMVSNISETLSPGGVFIGTTPNDNHIISLVNSNDGRSYESGILKIRFPDDRPDPPSLFGDTYHFFLEEVVDCPEFVVHFPTVIRLFNKYGMKLIYDRTFADMYRDAKPDRELQRLLFRMRALEKVTVENASKDYDHIRDFAAAGDHQEVKTLSKKEWDAISIYRGFAFMKNSDTKTTETRET